ncbi:protease inhibitor I9 family protein [Pseudomonas monteilii]|uniref:protease inhibitor I9 family protein n=1 Tax=Pseudomonas monteilii TaxID=76759 RepID=UPI0008636B56|nr:protease inhibitor I9 family protein [Pseudomonas monteilii]
MDLKDFIANSLTQIAEGILQASEALADTDAEVNPTKIETYSNSAQGYARTLKPEDARSLSRTRIVERVSFDVAVTTEGETKGNAGLKVGIASFGLNAGGGITDKTGQASRIQFTIPMVFPSKRNGSNER